jgi:kexin
MPLRRAVVLLAVVLCLLSITGTSNAAAQNQDSTAGSRKQPAKRSYDTHSYYVMELSEGSDELEAQMLAGTLGAELVEQVGELRDHWLLRAPFELEKRDMSHQGQDRVMQRYYDLALEQHDMRHAQPLKWIQQYTVDEASQHQKHNQDSHTKRSSKELHSRSVSPNNIVSLEKQVLKKRVKRQLPEDFLEKRSPSRLHSRDTTGGVSQFLRDIAEKFSIADPLWPKQWHLANDKMPENSINVTGVWEQGITGAGIKVAIVDDGLDSKLFIDGSTQDSSLCLYLPIQQCTAVI